MYVGWVTHTQHRRRRVRCPPGEVEDQALGVHTWRSAYMDARVQARIRSRVSKHDAPLCGGVVHVCVACGCMLSHLSVDPPVADRLAVVHNVLSRSGGRVGCERSSRLGWLGGSAAAVAGSGRTAGGRSIERE